MVNEDTLVTRRISRLKMTIHFGGIYNKLIIDSIEKENRRIIYLLRSSLRQLSIE